MAGPSREMENSAMSTTEYIGRNSPSSSVCYQGEHLGVSHWDMEEKSDESLQVFEAATKACSSSSGDGSADTPRSETPLPGGTTAASRLQSQSKSSPSSITTEGYFSPKPVRYFPARLPTNTSSTASSPTDLSGVQHNHLREPPTPSPQPKTPPEHIERPTVQRDLSTSSTASTATVRAYDFAVPAQPSSRWTGRDVPHFPNQSYAALQFQHYPPPYVPHVLRTRSSNPAPHHSYSISGSALTGRSQDELRNLRESGSRTTGPSPASSPGLYTPTSSPLRPAFPEDHLGAYPSPYLHFTHRQIPKETHKADVDVDPISGRKLINQYEIIDELGRGVHGKVKLGRNLENGQYVAIKIVDRFTKKRRLGKSSSHEDKIKKEIAILKKARHPNIVSLLEVIDDPEKRKVYIVLEHVEMGEVRWRTVGAKEITLVEYRRFQRERRGIFENEAALREDERILEKATQRRERKERRRWREMRKRQAEEAGDVGWSFEYGGDSDREEDSDTDTRSFVSTAPSDSVHSQNIVHEADPRANHPETAHNKQETGSRDIEETPPHTEGDYHTAESSFSWQDQNLEPDYSHTGLEGTMYGAYDFDPPRGRTPSVASIATSRGADVSDASEIPEHFRYVPLMTLNAARAAFRDTVLGLEYLHYQGVIHRDIKPANLLQTKDHHIKISDFGVSYLGRGTGDDNGDQSESEAQNLEEAVELAKTVGTPAFYAPELCQTECDAETPPVTGQIDVWALGVTLYCLIYGRVPFHDNNTFALMRRIAEEEAYIPRYRLKAVDEQAGSRPSSHGRFSRPISSNKRHPHELAYEEVDDVLYDLLRRLLIRDPMRRIKLTEVKHHPWLLDDISNPTAWLDDTDPSRQTHGRRIEVTKEDVADAVVPLNLVERAISGVRKIAGALGLSRSRSTRRGRAQSSATNSEQQPSSNASSSTTISQDSRRPSLRPDDSIFAALARSREGEHPLSHSVTASPEIKDRPEFFIGPESRPESPVPELQKISSRSRPGPPDRAHSTLSSTGSIRTIRPRDLGSILGPTSSTHPALPSTPLATPLPLETPGSSLGGIFGGAGRRILKSVRSRERSSGSHADNESTKSVDRIAVGGDDAHSEPSLGISIAVAAGRVDPPPLPMECSSGSPVVSATSSRAASVTSGEFLRPTAGCPPLSRDSSVSSIASNKGNTVGSLEERVPFPGTFEFSSFAASNSEERLSRARDELVRKRILEGRQNRDRAASVGQRPPSALSQGACPPSPDDEIFFQKQAEATVAALRHHTMYDLSSGEPMISVDPVGRPKPITASSSEDHFTSGLSQSTSNPSIPSIISADSSIVPEDGLYGDHDKDDMAEWPGNAICITRTAPDEYEEEGYVGDHAIESADDGDDSDDDFIEMTRKKTNTSRRSESISNAALSRRRVRRATDKSSIKSTRSGSNNTMKKIRSHGDTDTEEAQARHIDDV